MSLRKDQLWHRLFTLSFRTVLLNKISEKIISIGLIAFSSLIGIRVVNEYLKYDDRSQYKYESSIRELNDGSKLHVSHLQNYKINTTGKDTFTTLLLFFYFIQSKYVAEFQILQSFSKN